jgi:hypothetical protein
MKPPTPNPSPKTRRAFLSHSAAAASLTLFNPRTTFATQANSQVSIGLIGCGGRGKWITDLFRKHGGYHLAAVADYFPDRAEAAADELTPNDLEHSIHPPTSPSAPVQSPRDNGRHQPVLTARKLLPKPL